MGLGDLTDRSNVQSVISEVVNGLLGGHGPVIRPNASMHPSRLRYRQPGKRKELMRVLQLKAPFVFRYSVVK